MKKSIMDGFGIMARWLYTILTDNTQPLTQLACALTLSLGLGQGLLMIISAIGLPTVLGDFLAALAMSLCFAALMFLPAVAQLTHE